MNSQGLRGPHNHVPFVPDEPRVDIEFEQNGECYDKGPKVSVSILSVQPDGSRAIRGSIAGPLGSVVSTAVPVQESRTYRFTILTDSNVHDVSVTSGQEELLSGVLASSGPVLVHTTNPIPGNFRRQ